MLREGIAKHRWWIALSVVALVMLAIAPYFLSPFHVRVGQQVLFAAGLALSWTILGGFAGYWSFGHAAFTDRLGDTFRWKGENVATTEVEAALSTDPQVEEATVFGVEVPGTGGRAGMAAIQLKEGEKFDGKTLAKAAYDRLPGYAVPLFVRVVGELAHTSTFKSQKVDLRKEGYGPDLGDPVYVLAGRDEGYVPFYDEYPDEVKAGNRPKN